MRIGGKPQSAILLGNDHGEEFMRLEESPSFRRQVTPFPIDAPIVQQSAEVFYRTSEERLFFVR